MTDIRKNGDPVRDMDNYMHRARIERGKAARRFFRRLIGAVDKADTNTWG